MKTAIKIFTGVLLLLLLGISCEKEITNPFDPDCPKDIWTPENFKAIQTENKLNLTWEQDNINITGFKIDRKVGTLDWTEVASPGKTATSWSDSDLKGGEVHQYRLYAYAGNNNSNTVTASTTPILPAVLVVTTPTVISETIATFNGNVNANGSSTKVSFKYKDKTSTTWITVAATPPSISGNSQTNVNVTITSLSPETYYEYSLAGVNASGSSESNLIGFCTPSLSFKDLRDETTYKIVKIGNQWWMAENLAYLPKVSPPTEESNSDPCYYVYGYNHSNISEAKATDNYKTYGVLYNLPAAKISCPSGWHLPFGEDWDTLWQFLGMTNAGGKLKETGTSHWSSPNTGATNETGFTGQPGGLRANGAFTGIGTLGMWRGLSDHNPNGWDCVLLSNRDDLGFANWGSEMGMSVRCIKD